MNETHPHIHRSIPESFHNHSLLSLFPRAFSDPKLIRDSNQSDDLDSIHTYMKSMALVNQDKLFEEAKSVVEGLAPFSAVHSKSSVVEGKDDEAQRVPLAPKPDQSSSDVNRRLHNDPLMKQGESFLKLDNHDGISSKKNNESVIAKGKENPRLRRPDSGLDRKKAHFFLTSNSSQPSINLEPTEAMYQLQDPEEFFTAFLNLENAKKEIERQTGNAVGNAMTYEPPASRRRPGLSEYQRSVTYKHSYPSMVSESDGMLTSLQEETNDTLHETTNFNALSEKKTLEGSPAEKKRKVDEVVNEVLFNSQHLDGEEALSRIQEILQIKPIDLDKLCHPRYHDMEIPEFDTFEEFPQARKSFKETIEIGSSSRTPLQKKKVVDSPVNPLTSPTPPKSPFASISLLKKRLSQKSPLNDSFSSRNIDECIADIPSLGQLDQDPGNVDTFEKSRDSPPLGVEIMHEDSNDHDLETGAGLSESQADTGVNKNNDMQDVANDIMEETASDEDTNISIRGSIVSQKISSTKQNGSTARDENVEDLYKEAEPIDQEDAHIESSTIEKSNSGTQLDEDNSSVNRTTLQPTETPKSSHSVQHKESRIPVQVQRASKGRPKKKVVNKRQSLADFAWSKDAAEVRRSSRIKRKPLEYWKGERFLYGRIHGSLPTVIGIKYLSPGKENTANPTLRVQSFVSDEFKDLVDLAALH